MLKWTIPGSLLLLFSSMIVAGPRNLMAPSPSHEVKGEILLRKIIGGLSKATPDSPVFDCKVLSTEVNDLAATKKLISDISHAKTQVSLHIVARTPSLELYAYEGKKQILIYRDYSTLDVPTSKVNPEDPDLGNTRHPASIKLQEILDIKCRNLESK